MSEIATETIPPHLQKLFKSAKEDHEKWGVGLPTLERLEELYAQEKALADRTLAAEAEKLGIPRRYMRATLEIVNQAVFPPGVGAALAESREAVVVHLNAGGLRRVGRALTLCGTPGTGKTFAACAAIRHIGYQGRVFWKTSWLRASLMDLDRRGGILDSLTTGPLLVLDDVGMEFTREGDFFEAVLDAVIDEREANMRPMILTSNLVPEKLAAKLGPRAWDRLSGDWGTIKTIVGPSARKSQPPRSAKGEEAA